MTEAVAGAASPPLLEVRAVSRRFGGLTALKAVDLAVAPRSIVGLIGPNGAGKTTLFNLIAGRLAPSEGAILFDGADITAATPDRRCRMGIARTFQITQPFPDLSVEENVMVGLLGRPMSMRERRCEAGRFLDMVGLSAKGTDAAKRLSTGQRKRLELARAMATGPKLLLMDEVTGGVDHASLEGLIELVKDLRHSGVTIVIIEHNTQLLMRLADRILFLNRGAKLAEGTPHEVASDPRVINLYLGDPDA